jgi:hypothetical protein
VQSRSAAGGGGNYQTLIIGALRDYEQSQHEPLEQVMRLVVREELDAYRTGG